MSKKREIFNQVAFYSISTFLSQIIAVVGSIVSKYFLGPFQIGIWATLKIILDFSKFITLGTSTALSFEIPYQIGKRSEDTAEKIKDNVFSFVFIVSFITAIGIVLYAFLFRNTLSSELFYGLLFLSGIVILQRISNVFISLLRAYKNFRLEGKQMVYSSIVNVILISILSYFFKIYGFITAIGLSLLFNITYIYFKRKFNFKFKIKWDCLKKLMIFGLPLRGIGLIGELFRNIDKIMIIKILGFEAMGFYSIAIMACNYLASIHTSVAVVLLPHFQEKFGASDDKNDLKEYLNQSATAFSDFFPIVIGLTYICAPYFIGLFLEEFVDGISALKYLVLSVYFIALSNVYGNYLITIRKHLIMFPLVAVSCIVSVILNYAAIKLGYGILGVAIATTLSLAFNFTVIYIAAASTIFSASEIIRCYAAIMSKFLFMAAVLFSMDCFVMKKEFSILNVLTCAVIYGVLYIPFLIKINRDFDVLKNIKERLLKNRQNER